jgi:hypothetical protein
VAQRAAGTYARKIFGDDKIKIVLKRLDRLTQDEGWTAVAQTLGAVHILNVDMRNLIEGTHSFVDCSLACCLACFLLDGKASTGNIRQDLGMYLGLEMVNISAAHLRWQLPFTRRYMRATK